MLPWIVVNLALAAGWMGAMAYSLGAVQPKVAGFFPDPERREDFLVALAHGNRWRVVGIAAVLLGTGVVVSVGSDGVRAAGFAAAVGCYAVASGIFGYVSWRHWPARVFALPEELPGYQKRLRVLATVMLGLVGAGFLVSLTAAVR